MKYESVVLFRGNFIGVIVVIVILFASCGTNSNIKGDADTEGDECDIYMLDIILYNQDVECWDDPHTGFFCYYFGYFSEETLDHIIITFRGPVGTEPGEIEFTDYFPGCDSCTTSTRPECHIMCGVIGIDCTTIDICEKIYFITEGTVRIDEPLRHTLYLEGRIVGANGEEEDGGETICLSGDIYAPVYVNM